MAKEITFKTKYGEVSYDSEYETLNILGYNVELKNWKIKLDAACQKGSIKITGKVTPPKNKPLKLH